MWKFIVSLWYKLNQRFVRYKPSLINKYGWEASITEIPKQVSSLGILLYIKWCINFLHVQSLILEFWLTKCQGGENILELSRFMVYTNLSAMFLFYLFTLIMNLYNIGIEVVNVCYYPWTHFTLKVRNLWLGVF